MNNITKFLYRGCAYTVAISMLFFLFARILNINELHLSFSRYFIIFAFGLIVSASEFIFTIKKISTILQYAIHYLVLSIAFFCVFLTVQTSSGSYEFSVSSIFASLAIFSFFYFIILGFIVLVKRKLSVKKTSTSTKSKNEEKTTYSPRFK